MKASRKGKPKSGPSVAAREAKAKGKGKGAKSGPALKAMVE